MSRKHKRRIHSFKWQYVVQFWKKYHGFLPEFYTMHFFKNFKHMYVQKNAFIKCLSVLIRHLFQPDVVRIIWTTSMHLEWKFDQKLKGKIPHYIKPHPAWFLWIVNYIYIISVLEQILLYSLLIEFRKADLILHSFIYYIYFQNSFYYIHLDTV